MTVTRPRATALHEQRGRAMGSDAHLLVVTEADADPAVAPRLLAWAWARIETLEDRWSRFRPGSEISVLNRHGGAPVAVSADTITLIAHALAAWDLTDGRFDPTVGTAIAALGYDRDFDEVAHGTHPVPDALGAGPAPGPEEIDLDADAGTVVLPPGMRFDPGGIGKGLAADMVAEALVGAGALGALVNLGGDLRAAGEPPDAGGWAISLPDPVRAGRELARFALPHGAVATSSRLRRRWRTLAGPAHHLLDPATGRPATGATVAVSAVAGSAWRAEALATALFLLGPGGLDRHPDTPAIVVTADGRRHASPSLQATLR